MKERFSYSETRDFGRDMLPEVFQHIRDNYTPEDVFHEDALHDWAIENGYIRERDQ